MFSLQWYIENIIAPLFVGSILIVLAYFFGQMVEHLKKRFLCLTFPEFAIEYLSSQFTTNPPKKWRVFL